MGLAVVRALYYATMGGLQVPANRATSWLKPRSALVLSTFVAALGFVAMALPTGFAGLCAGLVLAGTGSSVQHPRASDLVTHTYGSESRGALGIYNFSGDLGKATLPAIVALLLPVMPWRTVVGLMGLLDYGRAEKISGGPSCLAHHVESLAIDVALCRSDPAGERARGV